MPRTTPATSAAFGRAAVLVGGEPRRPAPAPRPRAPRTPGAAGAERALDFPALFAADTLERIALVKQGLDAGAVERLARRMDIPKDRLLQTLGLARATVDRKQRAQRPLSADESSRLLGLARLVGQVQAMVDESGTPAGFDAASWLAGWLEEPQPALGERRPAEFMDTAEGQGLIANLLARARSGAYA